MKYGAEAFIQYSDFTIKLVTANHTLAVSFFSKSAFKCVGQSYAELFKNGGESAVDDIFTKQIQCLSVVMDENVKETDFNEIWKEESFELMHLEDYIKECEKEDEENMAK